MTKGKAVAGIVNNFYGEILIGKKNLDKEGFLKGKWHIPGETLEPGEDDKSALIRGIKEETGIEIIVGRYLGKYLTPKNNEVRWYECVALNYDIKVGSDLSDAKWVPRKKVLKYCDRESILLWPKEVLKYLE